MTGKIMNLNEQEFVRIDQDEFREIDYSVMGYAFGIQNELGRLFDEQIHRDELKYRLQQQFESVATEVPIRVQFETFSKMYFADLVINSCVIYELKAVQQINPNHRAQLLQYLLLTNLKHGKLLNFRSDKVEGAFVSTNLTREKRHEMTFQTDRVSTGVVSNHFVSLATRVLGGLGGFLSTELIYDAVVHFLGGSEQVVQVVNVHCNGRKTGSQRIHMLSPNVAFKITAFTKEVDRHRNELNRFLNHTELESIEWLNMNHHNMNFETIVR